MYNIVSARIWTQYFLFLLFALLLFATSACAENVNKKENNGFSSLEEVIAEYKKIAENGGWPAFPKGKTIKPGMNDSRIPVLRKILQITGDSNGSGEGDVLDKELSEAVRKFQHRHGLEEDGAVGAKTQAALGVSVEKRIAQMQATIEKMPAIPESEERYILVNIPGFYLQAVAGGKAVFESRIIVGTAKNATPLFNRPIIEVSFNPPWHVPERIAREEMMDKLRDDPEYFTKGNYVITDSEGETLNAEDIDWDHYDGKTYRFVQSPGEKSALGKVKFNLPDTNSIYLHSTGTPKLFAKNERALSHGCIRVERAKDLAYFVMRDFGKEKIDKLYDGSVSKIISVKPVPVHVVYLTSRIGEGGRVYFYNDIYGRER